MPLLQVCGPYFEQQDYSKKELRVLEGQEIPDTAGGKTLPAFPIPTPTGHVVFCSPFPNECLAPGRSMTAQGEWEMGQVLLGTPSLA